MGLARKQARALSRKMSGFSTPQAMAAIHEIQTAAAVDREALRAEVTENCKRELEQEIKPRIMGDMMILFLAYLRIRKGYGKDRLRKFMLDFNEFGDDAERNGLTSEIVQDMLKDECHGLDVIELFRECERASEKTKLKFNARRKVL